MLFWFYIVPFILFSHVCISTAGYEASSTFQPSPHSQRAAESSPLQEQTQTAAVQGQNPARPAQAGCHKRAPREKSECRLNIRLHVT